MNCYQPNAPTIEVGTTSPGQRNAIFRASYGLSYAAVAKVYGVVLAAHLAVGLPDQWVYVTLVDATDLSTPERLITGATVEFSFNGGGYGPLSDGYWQEIGNGDYAIRFNDTDTKEAGEGILRVVKSGTTAETKTQVFIGSNQVQLHQNYIRNRTTHRRR